MNKKTNKLAKVIITLLVIIVSVVGLFYYSKNEDLENKISYNVLYRVTPYYLSK